MKTVIRAVAVVVSGVLIAGTAFAQAGASSGSDTSEQAGSTKQESNHKARGRADTGGPGAGERESSGKDASADTAKADMPGANKQTVTDVQQALKGKGQDPGPIDGMMGPQTQAALKAYQKAEGLEATGRLDAKTKASLGIDKSAGDSPSASPSIGAGR